MDDVVVGQLRRELGLVDEHRDEVIVVGHVREDPLDGDDLLEAFLAAHAGPVDLGHPAGGDLLEELVAAEAARAGRGPRAGRRRDRRRRGDRRPVACSPAGGGAGAGVRGERSRRGARRPASGRRRRPRRRTGAGAAAGVPRSRRGRDPSLPSRRSAGLIWRPESVSGGACRPRSSRSILGFASRLLGRLCGRHRHRRDGSVRFTLESFVGRAGAGVTPQASSRDFARWRVESGRDASAAASVFSTLSGEPAARFGGRRTPDGAAVAASRRLDAGDDVREDVVGREERLARLGPSGAPPEPVIVGAGAWPSAAAISARKTSSPNGFSRMLVAPTRCASACLLCPL